MAGPDRLARQLLGVIVVVALTVMVAGTFYVAITAENDALHEPFDPRDGSYTADADELENLAVVDTTGYAFGTGPQNGTAQTDLTWNNSSVAVSAHIRLNESGSSWMDRHAYSLGSTVTISLIDGNWSGCHERPAGGVCLSHPASDPHSLTHVGVAVNGTDVDLVVNGSVVNSSSLSSDETPAASYWYGAVDDVRVFSSAPNASQWASLYSDPIDPTAEQSTIARIPFEEGSGSTAFVLYHPESATLTGDAYWTDGISAETFTAGTDYERLGDNTIRPIGTSRLSTLPRAYITYTGLPDSTVLRVMQTSAIALGLLAVAVIVIPAVGIIVLFSGFRPFGETGDGHYGRFR